LVPNTEILRQESDGDWKSLIKAARFFIKGKFKIGQKI